jgi:hypothetical protein
MFQSLSERLIPTTEIPDVKQPHSPKCFNILAEQGDDAALK